MDYTQFKLEHDDILKEAIRRCKIELYQRAQPSANYNDIYQNYVKQKENGEEVESVYHMYYISQEELNYVVNKYLKAYSLEELFNEHCDIIIRDITEGCHKDKYVPEKIDENGFKHPGYRSYEDVPPMKQTLGENTTNTIVNFIEERKNYYRFNHNAEAFRFNIFLGDSPCTNENTVKDYWKSQGQDLIINPRHLNEDQFWCEEHGYDYDENEDF